jgi:D-amino-acid dehydrogenase
MKVVVMGAGLAGVTSAWYLAKEGHDVVVVDREPRVAAVASFANGGVVAASRGYPWPAHGLFAAIIASLARWDPELWRWGVEHLAQRPNYSRILEAKVRLLKYSQARLHELLAETGIEYKRLTNGVLYIYRTAEGLEAGWQRAAIMRNHGFRLERLDSASLQRAEPSISQSEVAGAIHAPGDESGDSALFCRALAERCRARGVDFRLECEILGLANMDARVTAITTSKGNIAADAFVCALGVIEPGMRRRLGARVPVYPVKGYSATVPLKTAGPVHAAIDESRSVLVSPLGGEVRITGGAEFVGYRRGHRADDFRPLYDAVESLYPGAADFARARTWDCRRPMTPETTPRFGPGRYANLWFNVGHGHMGWAMAAGGGRITADLVCGHAPGIDLEGLRMRRS